MKILQINKFHYRYGGAERYYFGFSDILQKHGHQVVHFSMQDTRNEHSVYRAYFAKAVNVQRFSIVNIIKFFYNYDAVKRLDALLAREKPDIAHLHNIAYHLSPAIIYVLKKHRIPVVQTLHDYTLISPNYTLFCRGHICYRGCDGRYYRNFLHRCVHNSWAKSFLAMLEAYLYRRWFKPYRLVDAFIAPSLFLKKICVRYGVPAEKIFVINNFIPAAVPEVADSVRLSATKDQNYFLYVGRLVPEKGVDIFIQALRQSTARPHAVIVGSGPEEARLKSLVQACHLQHQVTFAGAQDAHVVQGYIDGAQAVVVPSRWLENMPFAVTEAAARGKLVIASRIGGIPELITHEKTGLLFPASDSRALAQMIDNVCASAYDARSIGAAAQQKTSQWEEDTHYRNLMKVYRSIREQI